MTTERKTTPTHNRPIDATPSVDDQQAVDAIFAALGIEGSEFVAIPISSQLGSAADQHEYKTWVLHVDDDADFRHAIKMRLEQHDIAVVNAADGREGVGRAMLHPASAIILDYEMPNGQGDYVIRRLKDNPVTKDIPVIVLTGMKDKFLERRLLAMGAVAFLTKPPNMQLLLTELNKHIQQPLLT